MIWGDEPGKIDPPGDQAEPEAEATSRREALGRLAAYTAPAMLALLLGVQTASGSP